MKLRILHAALIAILWPGWQTETKITTTPLLKGVPSVAEFREPRINVPMSDVRNPVYRLRQDGVGHSVSLQECERIGNKLIHQLDNLSQFQLTGETNDGKPRYFAELRIFLVSIDPSIVVVVPHAYPVRYPERTMINYETLSIGVHKELDKFSGPGDVGQPVRLSIQLVDWINHLELSRDLPRVDGTRVIAAQWQGTVSLEEAIKDPRFPLTVLDSSRFPGFLEFRPK